MHWRMPVFELHKYPSGKWWEYRNVCKKHMYKKEGWVWSTLTMDCVFGEEESDICMILQTVETVKVSCYHHIWAPSENDSSSYSSYVYTCVDSDVCTLNKPPGIIFWQTLRHIIRCATLQYTMPYHTASTSCSDSPSLRYNPKCEDKSHRPRSTCVVSMPLSSSKRFNKLRNFQYSFSNNSIVAVDLRLGALFQHDALRAYSWTKGVSGLSAIWQEMWRHRANKIHVTFPLAKGLVSQAVVVITNTLTNGTTCHTYLYQDQLLVTLPGSTSIDGPSV